MLSPIPTISPDASLARLRLTVRGAVQGVGFRPFVYRLAVELGLSGWVQNGPDGVVIEVEAPSQALDQFRVRLERDAPSRSLIQSIDVAGSTPIGLAGFKIVRSEGASAKTALILPDMATCPDCLREILDPQNRRYRYPFTNCTHCGPRYSIIEALPYDRATTTMSAFTMCPQCQAEYDNPLDRRFHAQPNACPLCGPHLELWDNQSRPVASHDAALIAAEQAIREGSIVAIKGLGGFHFVVDARNEKAVHSLRDRKHRPDKPFALMVPSLEVVAHYCILSEMEERLLSTPEAPLVVLPRCDSEADLAPSVAPNNPNLAVMLPYTPLHHLLLSDLGFPIVATSGNLSDEPLCIAEGDLVQRLGGIADYFLVHNRPIIRPVDDSIVRVMAGREMLLRRARGYAPLPILGVHFGDKPLLAVGAHLKNTVAVTVNQNAILSQHIGNLDTIETYSSFERAIAGFERIYEWQPRAVVCDLHPDYLSTRYAKSRGLPVIALQHHYSHLLACMAEHCLDGPLLGVVWDGTGYGLDGTIWGGEFLLATRQGFERVAHLRPFTLPGGEIAVREPRRAALGVLFEIFGDELFAREDLTHLISFSEQERTVLHAMLRRGLNSPRTTSAGRFIDAMASLLGLRQTSSFEAQAAMDLEFAIRAANTEHSYFSVLDTTRSPYLLDWEPIVRGVIEDLDAGCQIEVIAAKIHNSLVEGIAAVAEQIGERDIVLTGGCFQNKYLIEHALVSLQQRNFSVYWHQHVPPNDGGIALGQIVAGHYLGGGA